MSRLQDVIERGTRAAQPLATAVSVGTLYGVTDEGNIIERSNGSAWQSYSPTGGNTVTLIATSTPTGTNATFSSLGAYTHLRIVWSARGDQVATSTLVNVTFNADGGANYDREFVNAAATTLTGAEGIGATSAAILVVSAASAAAGNCGAGIIEIPDYRGTAFHKTAVVTQGYKTANSTGGFNVRTSVGTWRSTAAITSIEMTLASGNFVTGSKFTLYGLM